ncbi:hypothetical protein [Embleya scabrispora]|uniref:hypothetical protein n=1 Tax=Embleya scabrispora TaxID=159449 RepID=UPI00131A0262|nr:hypothetical protein [Embleya scabrispora]MYS83173.1 hypothetical protein [Streptomyces sp. SID5474]
MENWLPRHPGDDALERASVVGELPAVEGPARRLAEALLGWHNAAPGAAERAYEVRVVVAPAAPADRELCWRLEIAPERVERLIALLRRDTEALFAARE